jgi:hypothetical protein
LDGRRIVRFLLALIVVLGGCVASLPWSEPDVTAELATETAFVTIKDRTKPQPTPTPIGDKCENCNGTGKVGDGKVFVPCPECDGTGKAKK